MRELNLPEVMLVSGGHQGGVDGASNDDYYRRLEAVERELALDNYVDDCSTVWNAVLAAVGAVLGGAWNGGLGAFSGASAAAFVASWFTPGLCEGDGNARAIINGGG